MNNVSAISWQETVYEILGPHHGEKPFIEISDPHHGVKLLMKYQGRNYH